MLYSRPATELIKERFSCRTYADRPIAAEERDRLAHFAASAHCGPFGSRLRFELVSATQQDRAELKGLGTYGFIKDAAGFIIGAVGESAKNLEDFGYWMERLVLLATDLGLGTCWLGGSFTYSSFAKKISAAGDESVPAVVSVGYIAGKPRALDSVVRWGAGADKRLAWEKLFFEAGFDTPLSRQAAGAYGVPLDMVRLGPSASNRQPWRVVKDGAAWHFYLRRTRGYGSRPLGFPRIADLQRVDMGIAMCHFELAAGEVGLQGSWAINAPGRGMPDALTEYAFSWQGST